MVKSRFVDAPVIRWASLSQDGPTLRQEIGEGVTVPMRLVSKTAEFSLGFLIPLSWLADEIAYRAQNKMKPLHIEATGIRPFRYKFKEPEEIFCEDDKRTKVYALTLRRRESETPTVLALVSRVLIGDIRDHRLFGKIRTPDLYCPDVLGQANTVSDTADLSRDPDRESVYKINDFWTNPTIIRDNANDGYLTTTIDRTRVALPLTLSEELLRRLNPDKPIEEILAQKIEGISTRLLQIRPQDRFARLDSEGKIQRVENPRNKNNVIPYYDIWPGYIMEFLDVGKDGEIKGLNEAAFQRGIDYALPLGAFLRTSFNNKTEIFLTAQEREVGRLPPPLLEGQAAIIRKALEKAIETKEKVSIFGQDYKIKSVEPLNRRLRGREIITYDTDLTLHMNLAACGKTGNIFIFENNPRELTQACIRLSSQVTIHTTQASFHLARA